MKTIPALLLLGPGVLLADTVLLTTGERVVGKVVPHGDFLLVGLKPDEPARVIDRILVSGQSN